MIAGIVSIVLFILILAMMTLGAVLLTKFLAVRLSRSARIAIAAIVGPASLLVPVFSIGLFEGESDYLAIFLGITIGGVLLFGLISFPVALFATRRLDRLTQFDLETFE